MKGSDVMSRKYDNNFKSMIINLIRSQNLSTSKTAQQFDIPLKTLENWITSFNKDPHIFDSDYLSHSKQIELLKKDISRLKKENDILKKTISLLAKKE